MKYSYCAYMKNMCARVTYTLLIAVTLGVAALLVTDTILVTYNFSSSSFEKDSRVSVFVTISQPIKLQTNFLVMDLPRKYQIATTITGEQCIVFANKTLTVSNLKPFLHMAVNPSKLGFYSFTCMDSNSYDNLSKEFLFEKFNLMLTILAAIFGVTMLVLLVSIWFCCNGWCGCQCCNLFTICCERETKVRRTEKTDLHQLA